MAQEARAVVHEKLNDEESSETCAEEPPANKCSVYGRTAAMTGVAMAVLAVAAVAVVFAWPSARSGGNGHDSSANIRELATNAYMPYGEKDCSHMFPGYERWRGVVADKESCEELCEADELCTGYAFQAHACDEKWFFANGCIHYHGVCQQRHTSCYTLFSKIERQEVAAK